METVEIPPVVASVLRALAQKLLTAAATTLTGYGLLSLDMKDDFVGTVTPLAVSAVLWAASFAWTWWHEKGRTELEHRLLEAAPTPVEGVGKLPDPTTPA